ncbi:TKL protein kinase, partial [Phytophthora palmivora]
MASLLSSSSGHNWTTTPHCLASCALNAAFCLVSPQTSECLMLSQTTATDEWRVALQDTQNYSFESVELPHQVQTLQLQGNKTRVQFDASSRWTGERLAALLFIGLDLTNTTFPTLPSTLTHLEIVGCVLNKLPLAWLVTLPKLETLVLADNTLTDERMELSEQQFTWLKTRISGDSAWKQGKTDTTECTDVKGGSVQRLGGYQVCVVPDDVAVARQLLLSISFESDESHTEDTDGSAAIDVKDTSTLVLLSMALPFIYFLYK